ncbi:NnrS family protein [Piscinibacter aquaticus]|uniref:NnrS family protein n=1 Tax=Piscinibacter aquaticus TaxID=392597 RepID=A0A5C6TZX7_9BURK|nr:NnrS family protein [Piscinibacter aquaticus]
MCGAAAGYAWLGLGLLALGASLASGRHAIAALHLITVGALGTLTFNVMASTWTLRARRGLADVPLITLGTVLLAAATGLRVRASFDAARAWAWIEAAAVCWSAAFVLLLVIFWRCAAARRRHLERVAQRADDSSSIAFWTAR